MLELTSEKPGTEAVEEELPPPPPEPEPEPEAAEPKDFEYEHSWDEDYEEHIDGKELPPPKPDKKRGYGGLIVIIIIILILILWTVFSPKILPEVGSTYVESHHYANLGNYVGDRDIWAGEMVWGVAISGPSNATVGETIDITVMVTKISEKPGNWFFEGTAVSLRNVSFYDENGTFVAEMSNWTSEDIGLVATVPVSFDYPDSYYLYVYVKFLVTMDMRIGFLPLESVEIPQAYLDVPIVVS